MKKTVSVILAAALVAMLSCGAMAEKVKTPASDGSLNVRSGPGTGYSVVTWVKNGQDITVVEKTSPWSKIMVNATGKTGYINAKYIVSDAASVPMGSDHLGAVITKYASSSVNVRKGPGTVYESAFKLLSGTKVNIEGASGNWYYITSASGSGYISKNYVSDGAFMTTSANVHMRSGAGTGYAILTVLGKGTKVCAKAVSGNWTKVNVNGVEGYVYSKYVK